MNMSPSRRRLHYLIVSRTVSKFRDILKVCDNGRLIPPVSCWKLSSAWGIFVLLYISMLAILPSSNDWLPFHWHVLYYFCLEITGDGWDWTRDLLNTMLICHYFPSVIVSCLSCEYSSQKGPGLVLALASNVKKKNNKDLSV